MKCYEEIKEELISIITDDFDLEEIREKTESIKLEDGRKAQIQILITINEDDFITT